jgi:endonuclease-3 related protein
VRLGSSEERAAKKSQIRTKAGSGAPRRLRLFYDHLLQKYGPRQWWPAKTPVEVVIGAYLTQNTAWTSVEKSIANLEARELVSVKALREIPEEELRVVIRPSGYMIRKAAAIKAFIAFLDDVYGGSMDSLSETSPEIARAQLLALPGVGPETADAILLYALGQPAMVVDEYLRRVVTRHGLLPVKARYAEIQQLALDAFRKEHAASLNAHFNEFHALIVEVGKLHCRRLPKRDGCPLAFDLKRVGSHPILS